MIILNFAHPLTPEQVAHVEALTGSRVAQVVEIPSQVDPQQPLAPQVAALADAAGLAPAEWQSLPLIVNPPSLNFSAIALLAELHGRMGYFPACLRLRPVPGALPPRYEVAEILSLQELRQAARGKSGR